MGQNLQWVIIKSWPWIVLDFVVNVYFDLIKLMVIFEMFVYFEQCAWCLHVYKLAKLTSA